MDEESQIQNIWNDVWEIYSRHTGRDLRHAPELRKLHSTGDLIQQINKQNNDFKKWRKRGESVISKLKVFAEPVMALGGVAQSAVSSSPFAPASPVLGAVLFLVGAAKEVTNAYDLIESLFDQLGEYVNRMVEYAKSPMPIMLRTKTVATLTFLIEIFGRSEYVAREGRFVQYLKGVFLGGDSETKAAFERFNALTDNEQRLVIAITYSSVQGGKKTIEEVKKMTEENQKVVEKLADNMDETKADKQDTAERKAVEEALSNPASAKILATHKRLTNDILTGSCEWINTEEANQKWKQQKGSILWIFGELEIGKTFLSNKIVSLLQNEMTQSPQKTVQTHVAYFYIKAGDLRSSDQEVSSLDSMLKATAMQFAQRDSAYQRYVANKYKSELDNSSNAKDLWEHLFVSYFKPCKEKPNTSAFVVVDGLDHASKKERRAFFALMKTTFKNITAENRPQIRIAVTGRPGLRDDIYAAGLEVKSEETVNFDASKNVVDIEKYIKRNIKKIRVISRTPNEATKKIRRRKLTEMLLAGAEGMLPWAIMMLEQIEDLDRQTEAETLIANAPRGMEKMIRNTISMLADDKDTRKEDLTEMLLWIAFARRPLMLGEMDVILKLISPTREGLDDLEDRLRKKFASIFTLSASAIPIGEGLQETARRLEPLDMILLNRTDSVQELEQSKEQVEDQKDEVLGSDGDSDGDNDDDEHEDEDEDENDEDDAIPVTKGKQLQENAYNAYSASATLKSTEINFKYASIKDCLMLEERKETLEKNHGIRLNRKDVNMHIAITCLNIICDQEHEHNYLTPNLSEYAADNFGFHLVDIKLHELEVPEKLKFLRPLCSIFHDPSKIRAWQDNLTSNEAFLKNWFGDNTKSKKVRDLFSVVDALPDDSNFAPAELEWMQNAAKSAKELFQPLANFCVTEWLTEDGFGQDLDFYVRILHLHKTMEDSSSCQHRLQMSVEKDAKAENDDKDIEDEVLSSSSVEMISAEEILELARSGNLEETAYWHTRLAKVLWSAGHTNAAFSNYAAAIHKEPQNRLAMTGISFCYHDREQFDTAIYWTRMLISSFPNDSEEYIGTYWDDIANWSLEKGDFDQAIEASEKRLAITRRIIASKSEYILAARDHLSILATSHRYKKVIDFAEALENDVIESSGKSFLSEVILSTYLYDELGIAGRTEGRMKFVETAVAKAIALVEKEEDAWHKSMHLREYASFLYMYTDDLAGSTKFAEKLMETPTSPTDEGWLTRYLRRSTSTHLSQLYYTNAVAAQKRNEPFAEWITKLENLCQLQNGWKDNESWDWAATNEVSVLGLWYRQNGQAEAAKECFKAKVIESIEVLKDDDPENDMLGYQGLAETLLMAGQQAHCDAAFAVCMKPLDDLKAFKCEASRARVDESSKACASAKQISFSESGHTDLIAEIELVPLQPKSSSGASSPTFSYVCNGNCKQKFKREEYKELHFCEICLSTCFCQLCIKIVQAGQLPYRKCSPDHTWYMAYPIRKELKDTADISKGFVKVDDQVMPLKQWLAMLKDEYTR